MAKKATTKATAPKKSSAKKPPAAAVKHIAEDLRPLAVPVASLTPDPRNANTHDERSIAEIRRSLEAHGQQKPIVVTCQTGRVIAGNGTLEAFRQIGWEWIAVTRMDADQAQAAAFAIRDNRTAQFAEWDAEELSRQIEELDLEGITAEGLGFTPAELDDLIASALTDTPAAGDGEASATSAAGSGGNGSPRSAKADDDDEGRTIWQVLVCCDDEDDQRSFLQRMKDEQRTAKPL